MNSSTQNQLRGGTELPSSLFPPAPASAKATVSPSTMPPIAPLGALRLPAAADLKNPGRLAAVCMGMAVGLAYSWVAVIVAVRLQRDPYDVMPAVVGVFAPLILVVCIVKLLKLAAFGRGFVAGLVLMIVSETAWGLMKILTT